MASRFSFERFFVKLYKYFLGKLIMLIIKEASLFCNAFFNDMIHARNIIYFLLSYLTSNAILLYAILLLDIIFKIKTLTQVMSIFSENKIALGSTLLLFFVTLYISAFFSFDKFQKYFVTIDEDDNRPYNLYCSDLETCLFTTINAGIRAGGGLGDAMSQPVKGDGNYVLRYIFDIFFFLVINIILMNIFFGIIIDSFA
jgi:hypothetical protein